MKTDRRILADEGAAWLRARVLAADAFNAEANDNPVPEEMCPPTHYSALIRLKPLPDGKVGFYGPGVETTPDRLQALLDEYDAMCAELEHGARPA